MSARKRSEKKAAMGGPKGATARKARRAKARAPSGGRARATTAQVAAARAPSAKEQQRAAEVLERLAEAQPDWGPTLNFSNAFELLVATILAAQATDEGVNRVTEDLFKRYRTPEDYVKAPQAELERAIKSTGFFRQKAKAIKGASGGLLEKFGGTVPRDVDALTELHGVGRKTASIVVGAAYGVPAIGVDRHVARVSQRLGFTKQEDPDKIEFDLRAVFPEKNWVKATWNLILHGRRVCRPTPECPRCPVNDLCPYPNKTGAGALRAQGPLPLGKGFARRGRTPQTTA